MLTEARRARILGLGLPIIGGMISQNVLNLVDVAMVGALGDAALAAVGIGGFANFCAAAFILGVSSGVQAIASRRLGAGRTSETGLALNGGLLVSVCAALPWSLLLFSLTPDFFPWLSPDPHVVAEGTPYLQARLLAMPFHAMNFAFRGYWNAVNRSGLYMRTLVAMHACNIALNWVLIFGHLGAPALGVTGAGIASAVSTALGTVLYFLLGWRHARPHGFLRRIPSAHTLQSILRLSVPAGVQQFFFAAGMTAFYGIAGRVGTTALAASTVILNIMLVGILPSLALGLASASLVGQALGRGHLGDAKEWGWDVVKMAILVSGTLSLPALLWPELLLSGFIHEAHTLEVARLPFRLAALSLAFDAMGLVLLNTVQGGAGATRLSMGVSVGMQWLFGLPAVYVLGLVLGGGVLGLFAGQLGYRAAQAMLLAWIWQREHWSGVQV